MTEFEMMKKMIERLSSKIDWEIEGNVISIYTSMAFGLHLNLIEKARQ